MKKVFIFLFITILVISCMGQERLQSPKTVAWNPPVEGFADSYEIAIQKNGTGEIILISNITGLTQMVDLNALALYGRFVILVRSIAVTETDLIDYSDWARSDIAGDVIMIDSSAKTFVIENKKPAGKPISIRADP